MAKKYQLALIALLHISAVFYFWALGRPDVVTDESSYGARAIGLVDFDFGIQQPTPWQWIQTQPPWWMKISFHDHPPLVFWLQHVSIRLFGETPFAVRVPSAVAGIVAVVLVYLIGRRLYSPAVGLASAGLFAFTVHHVWVSRIGLLESPLIAFILASFYCFLRAVGREAFLSVGQSIGIDPKRTNALSGWWLATAAFFLGLAFLAKYLAVILLPIFAAIFLLTLRTRKSGYTYDRNYFRQTLKQIVLALVVFLIVVSPVIIYNFELYRNFGHFDFQLSMFFKQDTPQWLSRPAQEALGSLTDRLELFPRTVTEANSPLFLALVAFGLAIILFESIPRKRLPSVVSNSSLVISHWSLVISFALTLLFVLAVGPTTRFLTLLTPWLALAAGYAILWLLAGPIHYRGLASIVVLGIVIIEALYSYASLIRPMPVGGTPWTYSKLRNESHSWGFNQLGQHLDRTLAGKMPEVAITIEQPFARELLNDRLALRRLAGFTPVPWGIVYDDNINVSAQLWYFLRRIAYEGWPIADAETFRQGGAEFFRESGVKRVFFISSTPYALRDRPRGLRPDAEILESELRALGAKPEELKNLHGQVAFRVYEFEFQ